jgi:hypothetical protein
MPEAALSVAPGDSRTSWKPVDWALDDWEQYAFYPGVTGSGVIESPAKVLKMWPLEPEAHHVAGSCFVLTNHPFISGWPSKAVAVERLMERVKATDGMWVATMEEIAEHARLTVTEVHERSQAASRNVPVTRRRAGPGSSS